MREAMRAAVAGCFLAVLMFPVLVHADDWEQLPSSGSGQSEASTPPSSDDAQAIADFFAQVKASPGDSQKGCEAIGMFADMMAIARDQGLPQQDLLQRINAGFEQKAAEKHVPMKWVRPIQTVVQRQVDYVYSHPDMNASQVQTTWIDMCQAEAGRQ